jgi:hypothetical protein
MEDEWVLAGFSISETRAALQSFYPDRVATRIVHYTQWQTLHKHIWVLILRMCWKQSRTNMLVCKAWCEIVMRTPAYWRLAYVEKLSPFPVTFPIYAKEYFVNSFDTFDDEFFPTGRLAV